MKVNEIEELLVRYYDGETNEAEEKELKEFFAQADVPAHLLAEKRLFMQLASQPEPETPEGLESKLSGLIDEWDTHERRTTKDKKAYTHHPLTVGGQHCRQSAHLVLGRNVSVQTLHSSHSARHLLFSHRGIRRGSEGTVHVLVST